jgi:DNA recombination protein RmuC
MLETTLLITLLVIAFINVVITFRNSPSKNEWQNKKLKSIENAIIKFDTTLDKNEKSIRDEFQRNRMEVGQSAKENRAELSKNIESFSQSNIDNNKNLNQLIRERFSDIGKDQKEIKDTIEQQLTKIRKDNSEQLIEMRKTVDEKLQTTLEKRLGESFKQVSDQLEQVHKGLGEMQNIASGVGDLKKVLSNVKTRGILGEFQLENILEELLTPEQYSKNVATKKGSRAHVEFAIKLPGKNTDEEIWMPIDSKFPIENYEKLMDAYEQGEKTLIDIAQKELIKTIESFAKDISDKYLDPPHTTDFGIMFLPIESLYAEVLRHPGLFEKLQREYRITITGPTTLSALLNSLQMGFRTLAVQKRSSEVWKILEAVKTEFNKFSVQLDKVDKQLNTASKSLNDLRSTRTNLMSKKLNEVGTIETNEVNEILELPPSQTE